MNIAAIDVNELLPHQGNMVLIDSLCEVTETSALAELTVRNEDLFMGAPDLPAWVGIELMSQVIAAWAGNKAAKAGEDVRMGFLLGTRRYSSHVEKFSAGQRLTIFTERVFKDDSGMGVVDCQIMDEQKQVLVEAKINVYQPSDTQLEQMLEQ